MEHTNQEHQEQESRTRATKLLAVIGFISVVAILAWGTFTLVGYIPSLLSSVGGTTQPTEPTFSTIPLVETVVSGDTVTLEWDPITEDGTYALQYTCVDGMSAVVRTETYGTQSIECGTYYNLGDLTSVMLTPESTRDDDIEIDYTVAFVPDGTDETAFEAYNSVVVEASDESLAANDGDDAAETESDSTEENNAENDTTDDTTGTSGDTDGSSDEATPSTPTAPAPAEPAVSYTYAIPNSDPNGYTDLGLRLGSLGSLDSDNTFTPSGTLNAGETGAIRFVVKNHGTRTSEGWTYEATLPGGREFRSKTQDALQPNETATITLGFTAPRTTGQYEFSIDISTNRDRDRNNHSVDWGLQVVD